VTHGFDERIPGASHNLARRAHGFSWKMSWIYFLYSRLGI
jgi:hypothetical protein